MESSGYLQEAFTPHIFFLPFFKPDKMLSVNFQICYFEKVTMSSKYIRSNVLIGLNFTQMWKIISFYSTKNNWVQKSNENNLMTQNSVTALWIPN